MTEYQDIRCSVTQGIAHVTVNRPDKLNAYRDQTADELRGAIERLEADSKVRALLLTGEGRAFGAGYDLSTIELESSVDLDRVLEEHFNPLVRTMRRSRLPIVAAVNGPCAGAAVGIALATDIVVAARSAYFLEPFAGLSLVPDAGNTLFLPRLLGHVRAMGMMLSGERIPAQTALDWGLLWDVVDDAELAGRAEQICYRLAGLDPAAVAATKRLVAQTADAGLDKQLDLERDLQGEAGRAPGMKEQVTAFLSARKG